MNTFRVIKLELIIKNEYQFKLYLNFVQYELSDKYRLQISYPLKVRRTPTYWKPLIRFKMSVKTTKYIKSGNIFEEDDHFHLLP